MSFPDRVLTPSKTFLSGEYAALEGYSALVLTHEPYFSCKLSTGEGPPAVKFHPDSPAGKLEIKLTGKQHDWLFDDPHNGAGGFGGSTAEFISVYKTLKPQGSLQDLMNEYAELFADKARPPSGADLAAQYSGRLGCSVYSKAPLALESYEWPFVEVSILVLKTNVNLATHTHLEEISQTSFETLGEASHSAVAALKNQNQEAFFSAVRTFTNDQSRIGLLHHATQNTAAAIGKVEGVVAVRGCGAMGVDVIAVFVKKESLDYVWKEIEGLDKGLKKVSQI